jgi:hypothetical protein
MIDVAREQLITLKEAAALLPSRPHISTIARWAKGLKNGRCLETVKVGGRVLTSREALFERFLTHPRGRLVTGGVDVLGARENDLAHIDRQLESEGL